MISARSLKLFRILPKRKVNQGCLSCRETFSNLHVSASKRSMTSMSGRTATATAVSVGQMKIRAMNDSSLFPRNENSNHQRYNFLSTESEASASAKGEDAEAVKTLERILSKAMAKRVVQMKSRHDDIMAILVQGSAAAGASSGQSSSDAKELTHLAPVSRLYNDFISTVEEMESIAELMEQADGDEDMVQECQEEIDALQAKIEEFGAKMQEAVLPKNEDDFGCDAVMEIRSGTGGEEACLFCGELMDAYEKTAKGMGWKFEILSVGKTDLGGIKEAAVAINSSGGGGGGYGGFDDDEAAGPPLGPYGYFKFESGVHRVQRVPVNDVRIHTSAASVAVLPAPSDSGANADLLPTSELRIETMRASGAGGQHVNTTDSAVRITHIPTGITAAIQDERSQHKNKAKAMKLISARVRDKVLADEAKERGEAKNALLGGGDRSERIRTYNYPQDRITDHRCKESEFGISKMLAGGTNEDGVVGAFSPFLRDMERKELLAALEEEERRNSRPEPKGKKKR